MSYEVITINWTLANSRRHLGWSDASSEFLDEASPTARLTGSASEDQVASVANKQFD